MEEIKKFAFLNKGDLYCFKLVMKQLTLTLVGHKKGLLNEYFCPKLVNLTFI